MKLNLLILILSFISFNSYSQCRDSLLGTFTQVDSCTNSAANRSYTVQIIQHSTDLDKIVITPFGTFSPAWSAANVTVNCPGRSLTLPIQNDGGVETIIGAGTFTSDFNTLTLNYTINRDSGGTSCEATYHRQFTGIDEANKYSLRIYPNPVESSIQIDTDMPLINSSIKILTITGAIAIDNIDLKNLNVESLEPGIYILELNSSNLTKRSYFIKQ